MNRVIAVGRDLLVQQPETRARIDNARNRVEQKYQEELQNSGFWDSLRLRWRMRREVRAEIERIAPTQGLYAVSPPTGKKNCP